MNMIAASEAAVCSRLGLGSGLSSSSERAFDDLAFPPQGDSSLVLDSFTRFLRGPDFVLSESWTVVTLMNHLVNFWSGFWHPACYGYFQTCFDTPASF